MADPRFLIAIDPGSREMGFAMFMNRQLVDTLTVKAQRKIKDVDERVCEMLRLAGAWQWPDWRRPGADFPTYVSTTVVYEDPTHMLVKGQARPIAQLYRAVGHVHQWARENGWTIYKYGVNEIKLGIAGSVSASKVEVEAVLRHEFNLHEAVKTEHEWDAIAVGNYHLQQERIKAAMPKEIVW